MPTPEQIQNLRERLAVAHTRAPGRLTAEQKEQIVADFLAGETLTSLAGKLGVTYQTISYHLRKHLR